MICYALCRHRWWCLGPALGRGDAHMLPLPPGHRGRLRTENRNERMNQELKRRSRVVRTFPNGENSLRLLDPTLQAIVDTLRNLGHCDSRWPGAHYRL